MLFNRQSIIVIVIIVAILCIAGLLTVAVIRQDHSSEVSDLAELQTDDGSGYTDLNGMPFDISSLEGKVLVVNAWASWCPFCKDELPLFSNLKSEFGDQIEIIAINRGENKDTARAYVEFIKSPSGVHFLLDESDTFYRSIGGFAMPETVFYDSEGNIVAHVRGALGIEKMRGHIQSALMQVDE